MDKGRKNIVCVCADVVEKLVTSSGVRPVLPLRRRMSLF